MDIDITEEVVDRVLEKVADRLYRRVEPTVVKRQKARAASAKAKTPANVVDLDAYRRRRRPGGGAAVASGAG